MKSSNIIFAALLVLSGCAGRPDYTLTPPASTEWVKVTVKLPSQIEVIPLDVIYRSEKCQREDYDSVSESHIRQERGYNPQVVRMESGQEKYLWEKSIAIDGGGRCQWKLSAFRIGVKLNNEIPLACGKNNIALNYAFDLDGQGYCGGFGVGRVKNVSSDLHLNEKLIPIITNHRDG